MFTIDPPIAKDLDDALDIKKAEDGTFKVRVHIADVSYFGKFQSWFRSELMNSQDKHCPRP